MGLHPRTLNRRLQEAGTSFRELHRTVRHELACQLLRDTGSSIPARIAMMAITTRSSINVKFDSIRVDDPVLQRRDSRYPVFIQHILFLG